MDVVSRKYAIISAFVFAIPGVISLLLTDLIFVPRAPSKSITLFFSLEWINILAVTIPPAIFAYVATYQWLANEKKFFRGWMNVAIFAWFSLLINPVVWLLVIATFFLYGFIVFHIFLFTGLIMSFIWKMLKI
jgi:hypothetical protein